MRYFQAIKGFKVILGIIILSVFTWSNLTGQNRNMVFSHFDETQGISDIFINGIVQDTQGFLWIATWDGLNRYDGSSFKVYKTIEGDSTSLSSSGVRSLIIDNKGRMWILCVNGINVYDSKKDKFIRYYINLGKSEKFVASILPDSKRTLWVGMQSDGLWKVSINDLTTSPHFKEYRHENNNPNSLNNNRVISIFEDKQSNIWISNGTTLVDRYNPENDNFEHLKINVPGLDNTTNYSLTFQLEDDEGLLWLGSSGAGVISWNRKNNTFKQYKFQPNRNSLSSDVVRHIRQDKEGILWISTDGGGLSFYDKKGGLFEYCKNDPSNPNSLSSNGIVATLEDRSGVVWIGTSRLGLNKYEATKTKFGLHVRNPLDKNSLSVADVNSFLEDKDGDIWIGGDGLNLFDKKTKKYKYYLNDPSNPNSLSSNAILCMTVDHDGNIWIGTYAGGLNCYDRKKNKFISYKHNAADIYSISHNNIFVVWADSKNNIWAGTMEGTLNLFDRKTGRFYQYKKIPGDPDSFDENYMTCIFEDSRHYLWIGTSIGLNMVKLNDCDFTKPFLKLKFYHYTREENANSIGASNFTAINEDHEGNMWFGTDGSGMAKMDMKTNKFTDYKEKDGLTSNSIRAIVEDNDNNLWISTTNGISRFEPVTRISRNFNVYDGLQDFRFSRAHLKTKDGKLYFGGGKGYNAFYPRDITFNKIAPNVVIADLKVFNKSVAVGEKIHGDIILDQAINGIKELVLSYKMNFFAFELAALDFTSPEKNKYAYKMEGFNEDWVYLDNRREAIYTNLDPGEYVFRVKASNNDGIWNETGTSIRITITPPWWQTLWFRLILVAVLAGVAFWIYKWRMQAGDLAAQKRMDAALTKERNLLRTLIDNIPDQIYVKDTAYRKTIANVADVHNIGFHSEAEVLGKDDFELFPKELAEGFVADDRTVIQTGQPVINREEYLIDEHGQKRWLDTTKLPLRDEKGQITGLVGVGRDITEQKKAEVERKKAEVERERLITELQNALADIKTLSGLVPICANCKKIRDDQGYWTQLEAYIQDRSEAQFSHSICPDCAAKLYPNYNLKKQ